MSIYRDKDLEQLYESLLLEKVSENVVKSYIQGRDITDEDLEYLSLKDPSNKGKESMALYDRPNKYFQFILKIVRDKPRNEWDKILTSHFTDLVTWYERYKQSPKFKGNKNILDYKDLESFEKDVKAVLNATQEKRQAVENKYNPDNQKMIYNKDGITIWMTKTFDGTLDFIKKVYGKNYTSTCPYCTKDIEYWNDYEQDDTNYRQYWIFKGLINPNEVENESDKIIAMNDSDDDLLDDDDNRYNKNKIPNELHKPLQFLYLNGYLSKIDQSFLALFDVLPENEKIKIENINGLPINIYNYFKSKGYKWLGGFVKEDSIEWQKQLKKQKKAIQELYNNINENNEIERVNLNQLYLDKLPDLKHVKVLGEFTCSNNDLQSLEGAPQYVGGEFYCNHSNLQSLEGAPQYVGGYFNCSNNNLKSLEGAPQYVRGSFYCNDSNLQTLEGAPQYVGRNFYCPNNNLQSLKGAPQYVGGEFYCNHSNLQSLEGAPQYVGGSFYCYSNNLQSLKGAPQHVEGSFNCDNDLIKYIRQAQKESAEKYPLPEEPDWGAIKKHYQELYGNKRVSKKSYTFKEFFNKETRKSNTRII